MGRCVLRSDRRVLEPSAVVAGSVAPPMLVVLHGHASSPADAAEFAEQIDPSREFHHVIPAGPLTVDGGLAWFDDAPESILEAAETVAALLRGLVEDQPASVVAVGYSQGAAALLAALTCPTAAAAPLAGIACVSGFLPDPPLREWALERLRGVEVLVQHGRHDEVVPAFVAGDLVALLEGVKAHVRFDELDIGHQRTPESIAALRDWVVSLDLAPHPR